ncbi:glycosyltransferase family 39 protein [Candidatus Woesebacteria bacterium]|nr:glycosyltransferase family 39 protein [Candidatus Woesebacteria bacterium]
MKRLLLLGIVLLGLVLRLTSLDKFPTGFTPDEASFGYDAYSIIHTGKDQWGVFLPLQLRSFGDFKMPLYSYLAIPTIAVLGLNELAVRLPNALIGSLAVLVVFFLSKELFEDRKIAYLASLSLATSPWHIALSRGAFEANLTTFFLPLGILAFLMGMRDLRWLLISSISFGLNIFSYHTARFLTPLIILTLVFLYKDRILILFSNSKTKVFATVSVVIITLFLVVSAALFLVSGTSRNSDIAIFNPTDKWHSVSERQYQAILQGFPETFEKIFANKPLFVFRQFLSSYLSYFSPQFLTTQGAGEGTYGMIPGRGVLYLIESIFLLVGLISIIHKQSFKRKNIIFLLIWILISPLPAAFAKGQGYAANRVAFMIPAIQLLLALGGIVLYENILSKVKSATLIKILPYAYLAILVFSLVFFLEDYILHSPIVNSGAMLYGRKEAILYVSGISTNYQKIVISRTLSEPHIYLAFYNQIDPAEFQSQSHSWLIYEKENKNFVDQLGTYSLGKYTFEDINYQSRTGKGVLLVGKPEEFPDNIKSLKTVYYPNGAKDLLIVDPTLK